MKKVNGSVTETLIVKKEISVFVRNDATQEEIDKAIRDKAYKKVFPHKGVAGWFLVGSEDVVIEADKVFGKE